MYRFKEGKVIIKGKFHLGATITIPENTGDKMTAIVIVSGSGKSDRDGNHKAFKFYPDTYKRLAQFFSLLGFITIRYDKRGLGESEGDNIKTGVNELVDDVISSAKYLKDLYYVDKIILCGHSEGAILSAIVNERYPVDGLICLGAACTSLRAACEYQDTLLLNESKELKGLKGWFWRIKINEKNYLKETNTIFEKAIKTDKDTIRVKGKKLPAKWIREHDEYTVDILDDLLKESGCPALVIVGDKDVQCDPQGIKKVNSFNKEHITAILISNMDHILREYSGERKIIDLIKQYKAEMYKPLHPVLLEEIENWLKGRFIKI